MTTVTRHHATDGYMTDTVTSIEFDVTDDDGMTVFVTVNPADRQLRYWSLPPTELMRHWVDSAIRESGYRRSGPRVDLSSGRVSWRFAYFARRV